MPPPVLNVVITKCFVINHIISFIVIISWNEIVYSVQYEVTFSNLSGIVYYNMTTNNTNITILAGLEFCVGLVAVDSFGRRGQESQQYCYMHREYYNIMLKQSMYAWYLLCILVIDNMHKPSHEYFNMQLHQQTKSPRVLHVVL